MVSALASSIPRLQYPLCAREIIQVVDIDGMLRRHDEADLVVVEARVERDLVRIVDVDRAVHAVDRRHVLTPHGAVRARQKSMAYAVIVYRAHVKGMLRHGRHGDKRGPALLHEHLQGGVDILRSARRVRRLK